jgi:hypothetical protein
MTQPCLGSTRRFIERRFPALKDMPLLETRACHYESSVNSNFIIDHLPGTDNAWIAGVVKRRSCPVPCCLMSRRVLGTRDLRS